MSENQSPIPRRESIVFFENAIKNHTNVASLVKVDTYLYEIIRKKGSSILVYITDIYTIGIADYYDIMDKHPEIDAIVTISNWNGYTMKAKFEAQDNSVGIFVFEELMGALNRARIADYVKKDSKGKPYYVGSKSGT